MTDFDKFEFERYIRDDLDGRLYWDDLMERAIDGRVISKPLMDYMDSNDAQGSENWSLGYEEGYEKGFEEGAESCDGAFDDGYNEGYEQAKEDFGNAEPLPLT